MLLTRRPRTCLLKCIECRVKLSRIIFLHAAQAAGSRPLIFSQWTSVLDVLEWLLRQLGLPFLRLDGSTAVAERLSLVDKCALPSCQSHVF